ncbi:hypothetical protein [Asticcacaulis sp. YBE204]|uniref:hypothetical protein n=1 Tax=Asticcacaulis sp. YBE204 TaxID=1282363 RepID=UPI0003C3D19E|nr:hypothetical protein [Asticcacaulis sp. YBE204]ESQ79220.1 hypothetical protein AEYBE204_09430 [Asticcacaulis sp. YBE204]
MLTPEFIQPIPQSREKVWIRRLYFTAEIKLNYRLRLVYSLYEMTIIIPCTEGKHGITFALGSLFIERTQGQSRQKE